MTSFDGLGLRFDQDLARELSSVAVGGTFSPSAAELTERIEKKDMTMVQEPRALELGRRLVRPIVDTLFVDHPEAARDWELYAMNCYETGGTLGAHQDSVDKTVLIVTASGVRNIDVYPRDQKEGAFGEPENSFRLDVGSIMVLDGEADAGHAIQCVEGPSVSAVLDVPAMLRS